MWGRAREVEGAEPLLKPSPSAEFVEDDSLLADAEAAGYAAGAETDVDDDDSDDMNIAEAAFMMLAPAVLEGKAHSGGGHGGGGGPSAGSAMATLSVTIIGAGVMALPNVFRVLGCGRRGRRGALGSHAPCPPASCPPPSL